MGVLGQETVMAPQLIDCLASLKTDIFRSLHCIKIAQIQSFDATKKTVKAQILFKRVLPDGTISSYPVLVDCPVFTPQGGGGALQFPIAAGDQCLILFADRNIDAWFSTGSEAAPNTPRCHDMSDGIALVGINALTSTMAAYDSHVNLRLPASEKLVVSGGTAAEILGTSLLALKADVDSIMSYLATFMTVFNAHVHTSALPGNPTSSPVTPFTTTPPTMVGTTKLKGS